MNVLAFSKINRNSDIIMGHPKNDSQQFLVQLRSNLSTKKEYCTDSEDDAYMVYEAWEKKCVR